MEIVRCYVGNYDGRRQGLVVAKNQKEAAKIAGHSLYSFRQFWSATLFPYWTPQPYKLYTKPYDADEKYWVVGRCEI